MGGWFEVDKKGLAKLLEHRNKGTCILELLQNAWDQPSVTSVDAKLAPWLESKPVGRFCLLQVEDDDTDGFLDLRDAFTLYAESTKKNDPQKRGRFNEGEKKVLSLCKRATIQSTTGTIIFNGHGRKRTSKKREKGSLFSGLIRMSKEEYEKRLS